MNLINRDALINVMQDLVVLDIVFFAITTGVGAAISWHLLERPINGLKTRFSYTKRVGEIPNG